MSEPPSEMMPKLSSIACYEPLTSCASQRYATDVDCRQASPSPRWYQVKWTLRRPLRDGTRASWLPCLGSITSLAKC